MGLPQRIVIENSEGPLKRPVKEAQIGSFCVFFRLFYIVTLNQSERFGAWWFVSLRFGSITWGYIPNDQFRSSERRHDDLKWIVATLIQFVLFFKCTMSPYNILTRFLCVILYDFHFWIHGALLVSGIGIWMVEVPMVDRLTGGTSDSTETTKAPWKASIFWRNQPVLSWRRLNLFEVVATQTFFMFTPTVRANLTSLFSPHGEMIQFDEPIFQMGWLKPPTSFLFKVQEFGVVGWEASIMVHHDPSGQIIATSHDLTLISGR